MGHSLRAAKIAWRRMHAECERRGWRRMLWSMDVFRSVARNPLAAPAKVAARLRSAASARAQAWRDARTASYGPVLGPGPHRPRFMAPPVEALLPHAQTFALLARLTLEHRFDLLGSGWVGLDRGERRMGLAGEAYPPAESPPDRDGRWLAAAITANNLPLARRLRERIGPDYRPVSWNEDFKSGYVWPATEPSIGLRYGDKPGVDVKVPWELARMQHLPWLAFAAMLSRGQVPGFEPPERYLREIRDQVLDFISACPPRFGANWICTMDVAIRAANLIATHDILASAGLPLDGWFVEELRRTLSDHFRHIVGRLEYHPVVRANHYYSDIVGLLFVASWLPSTPETSAALAWATQEYMRETPIQFGADGGNFEASTSYHRLCGELLVYGAGVLQGLSADTVRDIREADPALWPWQPPLEAPGPWIAEDRIVLPEAVRERIERAGDFLLDYSVEKGEIFQFGDNDSGRLFKFLPAVSLLTSEDLAPFGERPDSGVVPEPFERINDHAHLAAAISGLAPRADLLAMAPGHPETCLVRGLARFGARENGPAMRPARSPARLRDYPGFGLFIYTVGDKRVALRCGSNGQHDNGGHAHNDQLSLCLAVGGLLMLVDPGTYVYTPLPGQRNAFRATRHHNTLFVPDEEQNSFTSTSLFNLVNEARPETLEVSETLWRAWHHGFSSPHTRSVRMHASGGIEVKDECDVAGCRLALHMHPDVAVEIRTGGISLARGGQCLLLEGEGIAWELSEFAYSPGYGLIRSAPRLVSTPFSGVVHWSIA